MTVMLSVDIEGRSRITSDRSDVSATAVGNGQFSMARLPGMPLNRIQALGLVQLADAVGQQHGPYPADHAIWWEVEGWLRPTGLTVLEATGLLGLPHDPPLVLPTWPVQRSKSFSLRSFLGTLTGGRRQR